MANAENHSYPLAGFARSSREKPGASFEEERDSKIRAAAAQENLVVLIREVMLDQDGTGENGRAKGRLLSIRKFASRFRKSNISR